MGSGVFDRDVVHAMGGHLFSLEFGRPADCFWHADWLLDFRLRRTVLDALRLVHQEKAEKVEVLAMALLCAAGISLVLL